MSEGDERAFVRYLSDAGAAPVVTGKEAFEGAQFNGDSHPEIVAALVADDIDAFEENGDPVRALRAFVLCDTAGVYPPASILRWLADAFYKLQDQGGKPDLRSLMGIQGSRGRPTPHGAYRERGDESFRALHVHWLVNWFSISIDDAGYMVWARAEAEGRATPEASWIAETYRKRWRKRLDPVVSNTDFPESFRNDFLKSFPAYCLPPGFKS